MTLLVFGAALCGVAALSSLGAAAFVAWEFRRERDQHLKERDHLIHQLTKLAPYDARPVPKPERRVRAFDDASEAAAVQRQQEQILAEAMAQYR